jgi:hypothetical protein
MMTECVAQSVPLAIVPEVRDVVMASGPSLHFRRDAKFGLAPSREHQALKRPLEHPHPQHIDKAHTGSFLAPTSHLRLWPSAEIHLCHSKVFDGWRKTLESLALFS